MTFVRQITLVSDLVALVAAFLAASWLRVSLLSAIFIERRVTGAFYDRLIQLLYNHDFAVPPESEIYFDVYVNLLILSVGVLMLCLKAHGAYDTGRFVSLIEEYTTIVKSVGYASVILAVIGFAFRLGFFPRSLIVGFMILSAVFLALSKTAFFHGLEWMYEKGYGRKSVLVLGIGDTSKDFIKTLRTHPEWGFDVIGLVGEDRQMVGQERFGIQVIGAAEDMLEVLHKHEVDEVVFAVSGHNLERLKTNLVICEQEGVQAHIVSDFFQTLTAQMRAGRLHDIPVLTFSTIPNKEWQLFLKRVFDIVVSSVLLILLAPLILAITLAIRLTSKGPIFYRWPVVGLNKKRFTGYKFRTMVENADELKSQLMHQNEMQGPVFKIRQDPRITPIGKWLRKFSLDELPQLYSVFKGDMSLVGPRPPLFSEIGKFDSWQRRKLSVKPGMTCLWQVRGRNEIKDFKEWASLDLEYIDNWSFWLDIKILFKTVPVVFYGRGC